MNEEQKAAMAANRKPRSSVTLSPIEKARANPKSQKYAIRAACWDCVGGGHTASWQNEVRLCNISSCGLFLVRPYQDKGNDEFDSKEVDYE
jgi:hypothetical protein